MQKYRKNIVRFLSILCAVCIIWPLKAHAASNDTGELPQIVRWENGNGYDAKGDMLKESWAYDTVNQAGKYVLFDANGIVLQKADDWTEREDITNNFTSTELETATIALRGECFTGFSGTVNVDVIEKSGIRSSYSLKPENSYLANISVNSGLYTISVEAYDEKYVYAAEYPAEQFEIQEKGLLLLKIKVTDQIEGEVKEIQKDKDNKGEEEQQNDKQDGETQRVKEQEEESLVIETGIKKYMLYLCGGVIAGLVLYLLLRNKQNKYN